MGQVYRATDTRLKRQVATLPIKGRLNTVVTPQFAAALTPDVVIVASGAKRTMPPIPGSDRDFVFSGDDMRSLVLGQDLERIAG